MFKEGKFYGCIRSNTFYWWWKNDNLSHNSHIISGLGGSIVHNSAKFNGLSFGDGLYYSRGFFKSEDDLKAGKDIASRYDYLKNGKKDMGVLAQAYLNYRYSQTDFHLGRQLVETFYTKSNDIKMIPNTFDGLVVSSKERENTSLKVGYLVEQKLRDHTKTHPVLMYGNCAYDGYFDSNDYFQTLTAKFSANDNSAMHGGLTYTKLLEAGKPTDAPLIVGDIKNNSYKPLKVQMSFYVVHELLSQVMSEANYKIDFGDFDIIPGIRYIQQFDNDASAVGGTSISEQISVADPKGCSDSTLLESYMVAAKIVAKFQDYKINIAYTAVADKADLVTLWRGFQTAGYTRSIGRYNWIENTKSYRLEFVKGANKKGISKELFLVFVLYSDNDQSKEFDITNNSIKYNDELYYYIGFVKNLKSYRNCISICVLGMHSILMSLLINSAISMHVLKSITSFRIFL